MQVSANNISPPATGLGLGGEANNRSGPESVSEFRSLVSGQRPKAKRDEGFEKPKPSSERTLRETTDKAGSESTRVQNSEGEESQPELKTSQRSAIKLKGAKVKNGGTKSSAVQKFMDSLEGELGITAERFSAALAQLPDEVKALPVQDSAPLVIAQLGIPETQQKAYSEAYLSLLNQSGVSLPSSGEESLKANTLQRELPSEKQTLPDSNSAIEIMMSPKVSQRQKLNATIDELNKKFFNVSPPPKETKDESSTESIEPIAVDDVAAEVFTETADLNKQGLKPLFAESPSPMDANVRDLRLKESAPSVDETTPMTIRAKPADYTLADIEKLGAVVSTGPELAPMKAALPIQTAKSGSLKEMKRWSVEELPFLTENVDANVKVEKGAELSEDSDDMNFLGERLSENASNRSFEKGDSEDELVDSFFSTGDVGNAKSPLQTLASKGGNSLGPIMNAHERVENLTKITSATEALAAKGGGEVKVILSPEGLGSVELKVRMQEGKVQVEMKAESKESQKLLESSLQELRQSLSSHRLTVDSVKVDVGGDFSRQDNSQSFNQPQFDMNREQARQFMNMFREGNFAQRQGFFEAPGMRTYRSQSEERLEPISNEIRPRSSLTAGKGREINLVA